MSSHSTIREDKTCLNCRHVVAERYCPNCGQENSDSRKTFYHLFVHFFEDLTHYENAFWKTIRHLLFKPGRLTQAYLSGRRLSYLAPVRLYIFISFVTFFLISVLPDDESSHTNVVAPNAGTPKDSIFKGTGEIVKITQNGKEVYALRKDSIQNQQLLDSLKKQRGVTISRGFGNYKSIKHFDSIQSRMPAAQRSKGVKRWLERRVAQVNEKTDEKDFGKKFAESFVHNVPKALFLYMPIFAFWLWVFHSKKRWYYFDHGIFTLHYFSFMLLTLSLMLTVDAIVEWIGFSALGFVVGLAWVALFFWWFFYFFRSHSRFYGEPKAISRLKSFGLYVINMWLISFFTLGLILYTILYLH